MALAEADSGLGFGPWAAASVSFAVKTATSHISSQARVGLQFAEAAGAKFYEVSNLASGHQFFFAIFVFIGLDEEAGDLEPACPLSCPDPANPGRDVVLVRVELGRVKHGDRVVHD